MGDRLEELLGTLLYEGYALYPYTPGTAKNSTPTPFGIVYPPSYAATVKSAHDRLKVSGIALAGDGCTVQAEVRFLVPETDGHAHSATERRLELGPLPVGPDETVHVLERFDVGVVRGRMRLQVSPAGDGLQRVTLCVHNETAPDIVPTGRAEALRSSMLSTHPVLRLSSGRFASPLERDGAVGDAVGDCDNVNTFPVLATAEDDVLLGAAVMLPDHPQLAPESRGDLFDGTEIEEALLLHVLALSDGERDEITRQDPAVRAMIERAAAATPDDLYALHGRLVLTDPPSEERPR
jgi:hypothetical protein